MSVTDSHWLCSLLTFTDKPSSLSEPLSDCLPLSFALQRLCSVAFLAIQHHSFTQFGFDKYQHMQWHHFALQALKLGRNCEEGRSEGDDCWRESSDAPCSVRILWPAGFTEHSATLTFEMCDFASYKTSITTFPRNVKEILVKLLKNALLKPIPLSHLMKIKAMSSYVTRWSYASFG